MSKPDKETPCEPSGTKDAVRYLIATKKGTTVETFKNFIHEVDGGKGVQSVNDDEQAYITSITYEEAKKHSQKDFVNYVILDAPLRVDSHMDSSTNTDVPLNDGTGLYTRLTETQHLRILSSPPTEKAGAGHEFWPNDIFDPVLGKDQTIYILDKGFEYGKFYHLWLPPSALFVAYCLAFNSVESRVAI